MELLTWLSQRREVWLGLTIGSVVVFVLSAILVPWLVTKLPTDYFLDPHKHSTKRPWGVKRVLKNILGGVVVLLGIVMLVVPGQGILTIIIGIVLTDFPGKRNLLWRLASRKYVRRGLNWIRKRANCQPLEFDTPVR